jgi:hypothetical protein
MVLFRGLTGTLERTRVRLFLSSLESGGSHEAILWRPNKVVLTTVSIMTEWLDMCMEGTYKGRKLNSMCNFLQIGTGLSLWNVYFVPHCIW